MPMRKLTSGEIALARKTFGDRIDYGKVRLRDGPGNNIFAHIAFAKGNTAITIGSKIYFRLHYSSDFSAPGRNGSLFLHEMTHVWQYQTLGVPAFAARYGAEFVQVKGRPNDMYAYKADTRFDQAMLEAQAQMVGDYHSADSAGKSRIARNLKGSGFWGL